MEASIANRVSYPMPQDSPLGYDIDQLVQELAGLPPGANPWTVIETGLSFGFSTIYTLPLPPWFAIQLFVLTGIIAVLTLALLATLIAKAVRQTDKFWLFSIHSSGYLTPHGTLVWCTCNILYDALGLIYIWNGLKPTSKTRNSLAILWRVLGWIPSWLGGWLTTWSLLVSWLRRRKPTKLLIVTPTFINSVGIVVPCLAALTVIPYVVISQKVSNKAFDNGIALAVYVAQQEQNWDPQTSIFGPPEVKQLEQWLAILGPALEKLPKDVKVMASIYTGWSLFLAVCLAGSAYLHLSTFGATLRRAKIQHYFDNIGSISAAHEAIAQEGPTSSFAQVNRSYKTMTWTVLTLATTSAIQASSSLYVALTTSATCLTGTTGFEVSNLLPLYAVAVLGTPATFLLLYQALFDPLMGTGSESPLAESRKTTAVILPVSSENGNGGWVELQVPPTGEVWDGRKLAKKQESSVSLG